ncbi:MAG: pYEATS domain-containing protein [Candidatus Binataceae bacterium]
MKDWIPLFQTALEALTWPLIIAAVAFRYRRAVGRLLDAIRLRVEAGDPFEAGTSGVKLGEGHRIVAKELVGTAAVDESVVQSEQYPEGTAKDASTNLQSNRSRLYLIHTARRARDLDQGEYQYYRLRISLEGEDDSDLDAVRRVAYHLHPTFRDPTREITNRETNFQLQTAAWGQFNLTAEVYLKAAVQPLRLERYINF